MATRKRGTKISKSSNKTANTYKKDKVGSKEAKAKGDMVRRKQDKKTGSTKATSDKVHDKDTGKTEAKKKAASVKKRASATKKDLKKVQTGRKADAKAAAKKKAASAAKKKAVAKVAAKVVARAVPGVGTTLLIADVASAAAGVVRGEHRRKAVSKGQMGRKTKKGK